MRSVKIRTTMRPDEEREVSVADATDLANQGLLVHAEPVETKAGRETRKLEDKS